MQQPGDERKNVVDLSKHRQGGTKKSFKIGPKFKMSRKQRSENVVVKRIIAFVQLLIILGILAWLSRSCQH